MGTTTISLERSAYDLLRARKKPDESFSEEIHRLLGPNQAKLSDFLSILTAAEASEVADRVEAARLEDLEYEKRRFANRGARHGRRS